MAPSALMRATKLSLTTVQCSRRKRGSWIVARIFALQALVDAQRGVNAHVTVGVRADLPSREMRFAAVGVQFFLGHHEEAIVGRAAFIGDREPRGALGNRAVANQLHRADADPLVSE